MGKDDQLNLFDLPVTFGRRFLERHAGHVMDDPSIALVELVANAYDAGATAVRISWPESKGGKFEIADDGIGMTKEQFVRRWRELNYSRLDEQGADVEFPADLKGVQPRTAFGQSGVGRHGAFCFADKYTLVTRRDGNEIEVHVEITPGGKEPFHCELVRNATMKGHGTVIKTDILRNYISVAAICEVIGLKFLVVPSFSVFVNGRRLSLLDFDKVDTSEIDVPDHGKVTVRQIDSSLQHRTTQLHGITWWVGKKMVGEPGRWDGLDGLGHILDGRSAAAKRYSFIIEADGLKPHVKADWTGFAGNSAVQAVQKAVHAHVIRQLDGVLADSRRKQKQAALEQNREALNELTLISRKAVGHFIDEVQRRCPTLGSGDLSRTVEVLATMETSRNGQDLLRELAACSADDMDALYRILQKWNVREAELVLSELEWRLKLLRQLQTLVNNPSADELHQLHPLFERGLWIFGPEFDGVEFTSNVGLNTTIAKLLGGSDATAPRKRTDLVALADGSISAHTRDSYDDDGEVDGIGKVLIVELKRGGFEIGETEITQARKYAKEIKRAHRIRSNTEIVAFVLGSTCAEDASEDETIGDKISIRPRRYDILLKRAHARMFNLQKHIKQSPFVVELDPDVEEVMSRPQQMTFPDVAKAAVSDLPPQPAGNADDPSDHHSPTSTQP